MSSQENAGPPQVVLPPSEGGRGAARPRVRALPSALLRSLSLDALRGFESAARLLSFTAAAEELSLTQSAVSKQVKALEDALGAPLFVRGARGLVLTGEGAVLFDDVGDALARLALAVERVQRGASPARARIAVTTSPSFASLWLVPRLPAFQARHPGVDIDVDSSTQNLQLERTGVDVAIRLTRSEDLPAGEVPLLRQRAMLVATPELAARIATPADLAREALLVFSQAGERFSQLSWARWHQRLGITAPPTQARSHFSQYEDLLRACAQGMGVAIGLTPLVAPRLASGELAVVLPQHAVDGPFYRLLVAPGSAQRPEVQAFCDWAREAMAAEGADAAEPAQPHSS